MSRIYFGCVVFTLVLVSSSNGQGGEPTVMPTELHGTWKVHTVTARDGMKKNVGGATWLIVSNRTVKWASGESKVASVKVTVNPFDGVDYAISLQNGSEFRLGCPPGRLKTVLYWADPAKGPTGLYEITIEK